MQDIPQTDKERQDRKKKDTRPRQSLTKDLVHTGILALVALAVLGLSSIIVFPSFTWPHFGTPSTVDDPIMKRQVLEYDIQGSSVKYTYVGAVLPETLSPQEVVPMGCRPYLYI